MNWERFGQTDAKNQGYLKKIVFVFNMCCISCLVPRNDPIRITLRIPPPSPNSTVFKRATKVVVGKHSIESLVFSPAEPERVSVFSDAANS